LSNEEQKNYYDKLNDEELLQLRAKGHEHLNEGTHEIIENILRSRNVEIPPIPNKEIDIKSIKKPIPKSLFFSTILWMLGISVIKQLKLNFGDNFLVLIITVLFFYSIYTTLKTPRNKSENEKLKDKIGKNGYNEMMYCSSIGDINRLKELLEYGGDINLQDSDGVTPLMYSLEKNNVEITKLLISYKPDFHLKTKRGNTVVDLGKKLNNESSKVLLQSIN
jgi:hypothetical protein